MRESFMTQTSSGGAQVPTASADATSPKEHTIFSPMI